MFKRLLLTLLIPLATLPALADDSEIVTIGDLIYQVHPSENYAEVYSYVKGITEAKIPETITVGDKLYPVTGLYALECRDEGPYGWYTFYVGPFSGCSTLKTVVIPSTIKTIGARSFMGCSNLESIELPESITDIYNRAFGGCYKLASIRIPNSVQNIWNEVFSGCSSLRSITLTCSFGNSAFENCTNLTTVEMLNSVKSIGGEAFKGCSSLSSVNIPESVSRIEDGTFKNCRNIRSITIPNSITYIGYSAFEGCSGLTSINIPESVSKIGPTAFVGCSSISKFIVDTQNDEFSSENGILFNKNMSKLIRYAPGKTNSNYDIPSTVTEISAYAFANCSALTSIKIPSSISTIKSYSFSECKNLSSITIPSSVTSIQNYAFANCDNLSEFILLPINSCSIERGIFCYFVDYVGDFPSCENLKKVTLIANFGEWMKDIPADGTVYTLSSLFSEAKQYGNYNVESIQDIQINTISTGLDNVEFKINNEVGAEIKNVKVDNQEVSPSNSSYSKSGLMPKSTYNIEVIYNLEPWGNLKKNVSFTTKSANPYLSTHTATQSTIKVEVSKADDSRITKPVVTLDGTDYECDKDGFVTIMGLRSNTEYSAVAKITFNGETYYSTIRNCRTRNVNPRIEATEITPTTITLNPTFTNDDVIIEESFVTIENNKYPVKPQTLVNLPINKNITAYLYVNNEQAEQTFTLPELELNTVAARATSKDCAIICAETNMSEEEYGGGFEWRRYDAPDMVPSTFSPCPVANGHLEGRLKGLSQNTYYKYRPYYEDCNGQRTFGEWTAFITADVDVYFEPTVYTYAPNSVTKNSATFVGYAMGGSEDVDEQGFEYWPIAGSRATTDVKRVLATGQRMMVTLEDLEPATRYAVRAFASTRSKTTYGDEQVFETDGEPESAIEAVTADESEVKPFDIFTLQGVCVRRNTTDLSGLRPGLYIANGRKILVH